jgi:hypothetical protein
MMHPMRQTLSCVSTGRRRSCPDCRMCQGCSETRCRVCGSDRKKSSTRLSLKEQIELYNNLNPHLRTNKEDPPLRD